MSKTTKRIVAVISAIVMVISMLPTAAFAADTGVIYENGKFGYNGYYNVISRKDYVLVPGAAIEYEMVLNNNAGTRRQVLHVIEVDPSNPDVSIVPGYHQIDKLAQDPMNEAYWSHKELTEMAAYYEDNLGYNIVGGMNTDLYYNSYSPRVLVYNGESIGNFGKNVATGGAVFNPTSSILYVFKDAEGNISCDVKAFNKTDFDAYLASGTLLHAVGVSFAMTVKDGELVSKTEERTSAAAARSMVGVKEDGTLVICMNDGRGANNSVGFGNFELGESMLALGCKWAANCDGGGSSTFLTKRVGEDDFTMRSVPCDGSQRPTAHGIFVASNVAPTGILDVVNVEADYDIFAPGTTYTFGAQAIDTHGYVMDMPADATWALSDASFGTISNGEFVSAGKTGEVDIQVISGGNVVGTKTITIADPEVFTLSATSTVVPYSTADKVRTITLPIVSMTGEANVYVDPNVVAVSLSDENAGILDGFKFTATSDDSISGTDITVTYGDIVLTYTVEFGKGSEVIFDFEDADRAGFMGFEEAKQWSIDNGVNNTLVGDDPLEGQFNEYLSSETFIASTTNGGQVRNGNYALAWKLDNSDASFANWSYNVLFNTNETIVLRDVANGKKATTLGMWLYVPENAFPNGKGLAFQSQLYVKNDDGSYSCKQDHFMFTSAATGKKTNLNSATNADIPESRWVYASIDISGYDYLCTPVATDEGNSRSPSFIRTYVKPNTADEVTFYIDDITLDYSSAVDDRVLPSITAPTYSSSDVAVSLENGATVEGEKFAFSATVTDNAALDYTSGKIFVDGVEVSATVTGGTLSSVGDVTLGAGAHTVAFEIKDELGNPMKITRTFTVSGEPVVELSGRNDSGAAPKAQSVYYVDINVADLSAVDELVAVLKLNNSNKWETKGAVVASGFEATYEYNEISELLTVTVKPVDATMAASLENTLVSIPVRVWTFDRYNYVNNTYYAPADMGNKPVVDINCEVAYGTVNGTPFGGEISVATELTTISSPYHTHDAELTAVEDKVGSCTEIGYSGRTYCETCQSVVDWGTVTEATGHNYVVSGDTLVCETEGATVEGTGLVKVNDKVYCLINGKLVVGWQNVDGEYVYANPSTKEVQTGTITVSGITYETDEMGIVTPVWVTNETGIRLNYGPGYYTREWVEFQGEKYYFGTDSYLYTGLRFIVINRNNVAEGYRVYTFAEDGRLLDEMLDATGIFNSEVDGMYYVENGKTAYGGLMLIDGDFYYARSSGEIVRNATYWITKNNDLLPVANYDFGADGKMLNPPAAAPVITVQPEDVTILETETAVLEVVAEANGELTYQWYKDGVAIEGAVEAEYETAEAGEYYAVVTNTFNGKTAQTETVKVTVEVLDVADAPVIVEEPEDATIFEGEEATLEVVAEANGALSYQWYKDGVAIEGAVEATYETAEAGEYYAVITNELNGTTATTETVKVTVVVLEHADVPVITAEPEDATIFEDEEATLEVEAVANGELSYQWYKDGEEIVGATEATYVTSEAGEYYAVVTNELNGETTQTETVKVTVVVLEHADAPVITEEPEDATIFEDEEATLEVVAVANGELSYQWYKDGVAIEGATDATYVTSEAGEYYAVVTNELNGETTQTETVKVTVVVLEAANAPVIVEDLEIAKEIAEGDTVVLTVAAEANGELSYQWYKDGVAIEGAVEASYEVTEAGLYKVVVTNELNGTTAKVESLICAVTVKAPAGYTVSGNLTKSGSVQTTTIELIADGVTVASTVIEGSKTGQYAFENVQAGTYTVKVTKSKHAPREYEVTVVDSDVTQDVEIWLYGDANGDGVANSTDVLQINRYIANLASVFNQTANAAYRVKIANITAVTGTDVIINSSDVLQINRYIANLSSIFDRIA